MRRIGGKGLDGGWNNKEGEVRVCFPIAGATPQQSCVKDQF